MTPIQIWQFARRWAWLFALATLLAATASYAVSSRLPRVYEGTAKLLVTPGQTGNGTNTYNDVLTAERLTRTYSEVLKSRPVVDEAARQAGIDLPYESAAALLDVKPVRDTQLIQISARANDPETAASYANKLAAVFIDQTQQSQSSRFAASKEVLGKQVDQLNAEIADHTHQIDALRSQTSSAQANADRTRLESELTQLQQSYQTAVRSYEDLRVSEARSSDLLSVVEPAAPALLPVSPKLMLNVLLAALIGLALGIGAAFVIDNLDDRLFSTERLARFTGLLSLGSVAVLSKDGPRTVDQMRAQAADAQNGYGYGYGPAHAGEAYRLLRANLQFAAVEKPLRTLLVTSAEAGDGKSSTAANLAVVMAQAGQRVVLVDGDLRRPTQHHIFETANHAGLTSLLVDETAAAVDVVRPTRVEGLRLLPSGPLPPNPSELLASQRMRTRLAELRELADVVILDSPPVSPVSDPAVLAGQADGTLLVINAQRTRGQQAAQAVATLRAAGANLLGAVLNRVPTTRTGAYAYYGQAPSPQPANAA